MDKKEDRVYQKELLATLLVDAMEQNASKNINSC
jgi:hypothetical protein